jgi:COMPASS component SWD2
MQATGAAQPSWLGIARVLTPHTAQVSSLDFSKDGEWLLSSGEDSRLCLYSTTRGELQRVAMCAPYGATLARFTHDSLSVVTASPEDHVIRYMSLHENRYLRNVRAHTDKLVALEMSPKGRANTPKHAKCGKILTTTRTSIKHRHLRKCS